MCIAWEYLCICMLASHCFFWIAGLIGMAGFSMYKQASCIWFVSLIGPNLIKVGHPFEPTKIKVFNWIDPVICPNSFSRWVLGRL